MDQDIISKVGKKADRCAAAVLIGGRSKRMGQHKPGLELAGLSLLERALRAAALASEELWVIGGQLPEIPGPAFRHAPDLQPECGPLGGLLTALTVIESPRCLLLAADMPFVSAPLLVRLCELSASADVVVPRNSRGYHPLCATYARSLIPLVEARLRERRLKVQDLYSAVRCLEVTDLEDFRQDGRDPLENVNTPEELERARASLESP